MRAKEAITKVILFTVLIFGAIVALYPLIWMVCSSFKPELMIFKDKGLIIHEFTLENYVRGFKGISDVTFWDTMGNTFCIVIPVVIGTIFSSSMAGYAFVRCHFAGKKLFFGIMILMLMLPMHAALIPRYVMFRNMGWLDTYLPMIVPAFMATNSFFVYLFVQFIRGIPRELDEAATMDGSGPVGIFCRVIVPLSTPAIVTTAIFSFIWTYDDFFTQMLYINSPQKFTVSLALRQ